MSEKFSRLRFGVSLLAVGFLLTGMVACQGQNQLPGEITSKGGKAGESAESNAPEASVQSVTGNEEPGQVAGGLPSQGEAAQAPAVQVPGAQKAAHWVDYTDATLGFKLKYPDVYAILPGDQPAAEKTPDKLYLRVQLKDSKIIDSPTAKLGPANFSVEVYYAPEAGALQNWLKKQNLFPDGSEVANLQVAGAEEALQVTLPIMLAPNQFFYYRTKEYIYRVYALGPYSEEMLASFQLEKP